jgi:hypothetical protein
VVWCGAVVLAQLVRLHGRSGEAKAGNPADSGLAPGLQSIASLEPAAGVKVPLGLKRQSSSRLPPILLLNLPAAASISTADVTWGSAKSEQVVARQTGVSGARSEKGAAKRI